MEQPSADTTALEPKDSLIQRATSVFMRLGVRAVNMADVSSELGISKKTLYKYVSDKRDLILQCMAWHCSQMEQVIEEAKSTSENTIEAELKLILFIHQIASDMHPSVLFDLNKYHPRAFRMVNERRDEILRGTMEENIRRGQAEGLYREDVNPEVATRFLISLSHEVRAIAEDPKNPTPLSQLYLESALYHIRAIATAKGIAFLEEKIKEENLFT
jgi:AcrR family transcriptional regulator